MSDEAMGDEDTNRTEIEAVRADNAELDRRLLELAQSIRPEELWIDPGDDEWVLAQNLAHIGEFPRFFAGELSRFLDDPSVPLARTHEDPDRLAAVDRDEVTQRDLDDLVSAMRGALAQLAEVLERVSDEDLIAVTNNRRYGDEPMTAFFDRYVTGHKRAHVDQLERTIATVRSRK